MSILRVRMWNNIPEKPEKSKMFYDCENVYECLKQQARFNDGHPLGYNHEYHGSAFMYSSGILNLQNRYIFQGDIVKGYFQFAQKEGIGEIKFSKGSFMVAQGDSFVSWIDEEHEIIGNIYENPELLKELK